MEKDTFSCYKDLRNRSGFSLWMLCECWMCKQTRKYRDMRNKKRMREEEKHGDQIRDPVLLAAAVISPKLIVLKTWLTSSSRGIFLWESSLQYYFSHLMLLKDKQSTIGLWVSFYIYYPANNIRIPTHISCVWLLLFKLLAEHATIHTHGCMWKICYFLRMDGHHKNAIYKLILKIQ